MIDSLWERKIGLGFPITKVKWNEKKEILDRLLNRPDSLMEHPMSQGFEAEVTRLDSGQASYVLKVWNKSSKPDVRFQYHLLNALLERGVPVPAPIGWGIDANGDQMLLTTYDGMPVKKLPAQKIIELAKLLTKIHHIKVEEIGHVPIPKYDFAEYFFPGVSEHADLAHALAALLQLTDIKQEWLIHGDYHQGNIVEADHRLSVIDWTNGQAGDFRYDFAWSFILLVLYGTERSAHAFRTAYVSEQDVKPEELEAFVALACLRWMLLARRGGAPKGSKTVGRMKKLLTNHPFLNKFAFSGFGAQSE